MTVRHAPDNLYFVGPLVDTFFIGGASLLVFLFYRATLTGFAAGQISDSAFALTGILVWVGNWPHFSATSYRLYESREHMNQFALTAYLIPVLIVLAAVACFVYPVSFAPYFVKLFVLWSPYHFSLQTLGITLIYARRANLRISPLARQALTVFVISSFLVQYAESEIALRTGFMYALSFPQLALPAWAPNAFQAIMYSSIAVLAWELLPEILKSGRLPWIVFVPLLTQYLWFVYGAKDVTFQLFTPLFHSLQYMLIAWSVEMHSRGRAPWKASARWYAMNVGLGALFFSGIPHLLARFGFNLEYSLLIFSAAISLHHYFVDGVIWKLQRERTGSPLFRNVGWAFRGGAAS